MKLNITESILKSQHEGKTIPESNPNHKNKANTRNAINIKSVNLKIFEHKLDVNDAFSNEFLVFGKLIDSIKGLEHNFTFRLRIIGSDIICSLFFSNSSIISGLFDFSINYEILN